VDAITYGDSIMDVPVGELVLVRFWRWDVDRLKDDAHIEFDAQCERDVTEPDYAVSTFGDVRTTTDLSVVDVAERVCRSTQRRSKWYTFATQSRLVAANFHVRLSEPLP
jgi:hypothetical protein